MAQIFSETMREMMRMQQELVERLLVHQSAPAPPQPHWQQMAPHRERPVSLADFKKLSPTPFRGVEGPLEAEVWLKGVEKIFDAIKCADEDRILFATFLFEGEVERWWRAEVANRGNDAPIRTWEAFSIVFLSKYFPPSIRR